MRLVIRSLFLSLVLLSLTAAAQDSPLTLGRAVELAVSRNERSAVAETTVAAAEARLRRARSIILPQVNVVGFYRNDTAADTRNTLSAAAVLTQPLFDARAFPLLRYARGLRDATRFSATESKRVLGFDAADAFIVTLSFEQVLRAAQQRREFARTSLEDTRARFEAGLVSSNDVTRADLEMATAERGVAQATGTVMTAHVVLENLLNTTVNGPLQVPTDLLQAAAQTPEPEPPLVAAAQKIRTDILAARAQVEALRAFASEPSARFIPSVLLNAQTRNINEGSISNRNNEGFVGVTLNWPVLDAGVRSAERAERNAIARGAELELELAMRGVEREIRSASVELRSEQAALRQAEAAVRAARKNAEETNELYRQGLASALELADANQRLFEAEVAEVNARYRMAQAYLALREARGVGPVGE